MEKSSSQVMKGIIWAAVASAMWGISGTVLQLISQNLAIPATWMLSMRTFSAGVILLVISVFLYGKKIFNVFKTRATTISVISYAILVTAKGDVISLIKGRLILNGSVPAENVMIDGKGVGDIGNIVLRDRKVLSEDGIFVAVVTINRREKKIISSPQITSRGFVYVKASRDLMRESAEIVQEIVESHLQVQDFDWGNLKQDIRDQLSRYLFEQTRRRPVILPVIMESSNRKGKNMRY